MFSHTDGLIITAGAGIGVDSGLPDFRGSKGFWQAYPALGRAGLHFEEIAHPGTFRTNPRLAWGFYAHRLTLYRTVSPHSGFKQLLELEERFPNPVFVFTSNVDGQFQKAGFSQERIIECHGSIHILQCLENCQETLWSADDLHPVVDPETSLLLSDLPRCPHCQSLARPNILMFGDWEWNGKRTDDQEERFRRWRETVSRPLVIEIGAGTAVPSVRYFGEGQDGPLIRINPREYAIFREGDIGLSMTAREGIEFLAKAIESD